MSDSRIYLKSFRAKNFRSYGEVTLELPPTPGLVVLDGANGLGKTTWFEAVEMALCGKVHRWNLLSEDQKVPIEKHVRREAAGNKAECRVTLDFADALGKSGPEFVWTLDGPQKAGLAIARDPDGWSLTANNLHGFLRGTHFVPQSPAARLLQMAGGDQWKWVLSSVSGYSDIDRFSSSIQAVKGPLTSSKTKKEDLRKDAERRRDDWVRRVDEYRTQVQAARNVGGGLSPAAVLAQLTDDERRFADLDWDIGSSSEAGRRVIDGLGRLIDDTAGVQAQRDQHLDLLMGLVETPGSWLEVTARLSTELSRVEELQREMERAKESLELAQADEAQHRETLDSIVAAIDEINRRLRWVRQLGESEAELLRSQANVETWQAQLDESSRAAVSEEERLRSAQERLGARRRWEGEKQELEKRLRDLAEAQTAHDKAVQLRSERKELLEKLEAARGEAGRLQASLSEAEARLRVALERREQAEQSANALRANADEVRGLVARLMSHLRHDDIECPLCAADYAPGELLERAARVSRSSDSQLEEAELRLGEARALEADAKAAKNVAAKAVDEQLATVKALESRLADLDDTLEQTEEVLPRPFDDSLGGYLESEMEAAREDLERAKVSPASDLETSGALELIVRDITNALASAKANVERAGRELDAAVSMGARARDAISTLRDRLGVAPERTVGEVQREIERELTDRELARQAAQDEQERRAARVRERRDDLERVNRRIAELRDEMDGIRAKQARLEADWGRTGLAGTPSTAALEDALAGIKALMARDASRLEVFRRLTGNLQEWLTTSSLDERRKELDELAGGSGEQAWELKTQTLESELRVAAAAVKVVEDAKTLIDKMSDSAQEKRDAMHRDLSTRLQPIFSGLLRSLIVDRDIASSVLNFQEKSRKTQVEETLGDGKTPLAARASEGQLAGVGLAMQLSMALAFPWSRWPAVLLDDPSQFADVVHASNLVETLRLMSRQFGFQIFLSTHERDFARYVQRKFANDGLPATRVVFHQPRDPSSGIVPRVVAMS